MKSHLLSLLSVLFLVISGSAMAQIPQQFSFQGVARDANNKVVANQTVSLRISIRVGTVIGETVYRETHSAQTSASGVFNISIGGGSAELGQIDQIDWTSKKFILQTEMDAAGGSNFVNLGGVPLLSVPYAIQAKKAEVADEAAHAATATAADSWTNNKVIVQEGPLEGDPTLPEIDWNIFRSRFLWHPARSAMRFGAWSADYGWTPQNIGAYSFGVGINVVASGRHSFAFGFESEASEYGSIALGVHTKATGQNAMSIGSGSAAEANSSMAIGDNLLSLAKHSKAFGYNLQSQSMFGIVLGVNNDISNAVIDNFNEPNRRLFEIGNGNPITDTRSNALTILRNGNMGLGNNVLVPTHILDVGGRMRLRASSGLTSGLFLDNSSNVPYAFIGGYDNNRIGFYFENAGWRFTVKHDGNADLSGALTQNSDVRLKEKIVPIEYNFAKLQSLKGYHYHWKDKTRSQSLQTGLIAQEVEAMFPELVETNKDGFKSVNYIGLIPHLLEAVKALKEENGKLSEENEKLLTAAAKWEEIGKRLSALEAGISSNTSTQKTK